MLFSLVEIFATLAESFLIVSAIAFAARFRFSGIKQYILMGSSIVVVSLLTSWANTIVSFSFLTIFIGCSAYILVSKAFSIEGILIRSTACIIIIFFLHMFDYVIGFSLALIVGGAQNLYQGFLTIMQPGYLRVTYTIINKMIQISLSFILFKNFKSLHTLSKFHLFLLFIGFTIAYIVMSLFVGVIINDSNYTGSAIIIISWILIALCMVAVLFLIVLLHSHYYKKLESKQLATYNLLLEEKYRIISESEDKLAKRNHDFMKHLETLSQLPLTPEASDYIHNLYQIQTDTMHHCYSGDDTIDAIITYKQNEAESKNIILKYDILLSTPLNIAPIDICAVLANQLDNAIAACMLTDNIKERFVHVHISQQYNLVCFEVKNFAKETPFNQYGELVSSKKEKHHGLGVLNIKETVEKYDGYLYNTYENHCFTSRALLMNHSISTQH